jgi:hypothetical protein
MQSSVPKRINGLEPVLNIAFRQVFAMDPDGKNSLERKQLAEIPLR